MCSFRLEEDGVFGVSPEMGDRIPAVAPARQNLKPTQTLSIRTWFSCWLKEYFGVKSKELWVYLSVEA